MPFTAGYDKGITWTPDGGSARAINITQWAAEDGGDTVDVTSTHMNGEQGFIAALKRCPVSFSAFFDTGSTPASNGIAFGRKGTFTFSNGATAFSVHVIIERVPYQSTVNGAVQFSCQAKSDSLNSSGAVVASVSFS